MDQHAWMWWAMAPLALAAGAFLVPWVFNMIGPVRIAGIWLSDADLTSIAVCKERIGEALRTRDDHEGMLDPDRLERRVEAILRSEKTLLTLARVRPQCGVLRHLVRRGPFRALLLGSGKGNLNLIKLAVAILKMSGPIPPGDIIKAFNAAAGPDKVAIQTFLRDELRELGYDENGARTEFPEERRAAESGAKPEPPRLKGRKGSAVDR